MRNKVLFIVFILIIFIIIFAVYYLILSAKAKTGILKILTIPKTTVYLDGKASGNSPFEQTLKKGEYLVKVSATETATESAIWQGKVNINEDTITFIERQLGTSDITSSGIILEMAKIDTKNNTGVIEVESEPGGSIVSLDNIEQGITPMTMRNIESGDHELTLYNPGFIKRTQKVKIASNYRLTAMFKLAVDPNYQPININLTPTPASPSGQLNSNPQSQTITILDTETGWLRVREDPTTTASQSALVNPGQQFLIIENNKLGWYKIEYEKGKFGWISARYTKIITPTP
ncbi:MAG: hypothetical protein A3J62_02575 [Candidatus Buchananbacteria bacterium RIFCSPHIGHO2_02_FULL_38_8]|uniref:SH3b domain-containing protein n=1 Tax=Candidatus Buchananbacteria bacterium RIFCSPHIGHO2_02_FULL_38_8 TaxID=1797538 RepID=A0A1G1Y4U6_9BACT|nr:MAG: hypothetical protein A3J62_02575 [Candidatus Buchananbacteria bacterium RIFCSPHIGHO2_02_FULL_38_8]